MQVHYLGREEPLEREMATHSSVLAWRTLWTEEPGRLQCVWSQRVRQDWATNQQQQWYIRCRRYCLIPLTWGALNRQTHRVRKYSGRYGSECLVGTAFQFKKVEHSRGWWWWELPSNMNVLRAAEWNSYMWLKQCVLYYVIFYHNTKCFYKMNEMHSGLRETELGASEPTALCLTLSHSPRSPSPALQDRVPQQNPCSHGTREECRPAHGSGLLRLW